MAAAACLAAILARLATRQREPAHHPLLALEPEPLVLPD